MGKCCCIVVPLHSYQPAQFRTSGQSVRVFARGFVCVLCASLFTHEQGIFDLKQQFRATTHVECFTARHPDCSCLALIYIHLGGARVYFYLSSWLPSSQLEGRKAIGCLCFHPRTETQIVSVLQNWTHCPVGQTRVPTQKISVGEANMQLSLLYMIQRGCDWCSL